MHLKLSHAGLHALWAYRHFVMGNVTREFRARYLNTALGAAWLVLNPFAMIVVYTTVFSQVMQARLPGNSMPFAYSIFLCAGLLPWQWFADLLTRCVNMFVEHGSLLRKSSFPLTALPVIAAIASACNFAIVFGIFLLFLLFVGPWPGWSLLSLVPLLVLQSAFAVGLGVILGVLQVFFRDVGQSLGIVLNFWFWFTPIVYASAALPHWVLEALRFNPMFPIIDGYQRILLGQGQPFWPSLYPIVGLAIGSLLVAIWLVRRARSQMVDEL